MKGELHIFSKKKIWKKKKQLTSSVHFFVTGLGLILFRKSWHLSSGLKCIGKNKEVCFLSLQNFIYKLSEITSNFLHITKANISSCRVCVPKIQLSSFRKKRHFQLCVADIIKMVLARMITNLLIFEEKLFSNKLPD